MTDIGNVSPFTIDNEISVWSRLAAPLPPDTIAWRQDGKPSMRDGRHFARFVAYVEAGTVRTRLDSVVPGEWDLTFRRLPDMVNHEGSETLRAFKARLQVLGVAREDVGQGSDYKAAATDAFKRVAVRYGIGHELYEMDTVWVEIDGDGKFAKPLEDPAVVYSRRNRGTAPKQTTATGNGTTAAKPAIALDEEQCPKCGGRVWDNRLTKKNPKAPDFKCRDRSCDGVIWPDNLANQAGKKTQTVSATVPDGPDDFPAALLERPDDLPF